MDIITCPESVDIFVFTFLIILLYEYNNTYSVLAGCLITNPVNTDNCYENVNTVICS